MNRRLLFQAVLAIVIAVSLTLAGAVLPTGRASAAPSLRLSASAIPAGGFVTVTGYGFAPGGQAVVTSKVSVGGNPQTVQSSATVGSGGSFSVQLIFPGGTKQGKYRVTARDFSGHTASTTIAVLPVATIVAGGSPKTTFVIPMHRVWVNATGFASGETVTFKGSFPLYNGNTTTIQRARKADANGSIHGLVVAVPGDARAGTVPFTATGLTSKKTGTVTFHVVYRPHISVAPGTARPGTSIAVTGTDFVPGSTVRVSVGITYTNGVPTTLARTVVTNGNGGFSTSIFLPSNVRVGSYTVSARDVARGFHAAHGLSVSVKPTIHLAPSTIYPGQSTTVSGGNFGTGATIHISATVHTTAGTRTVTAQAVAGSGGGYSASLQIPGNAQPGAVPVSARSGNASVQATLTVQRRPAPAPTHVPPTATPQPTSTPSPHKAPSLGFRYVSIWYHWMRPGTREHIVVQSTISAKQGIWVHVWYPNGQHQAWYQNTDDFGHWAKWFTVPYNSATAGNDRALVTFRLWHGKDNVKDYEHFGIVR